MDTITARKNYVLPQAYPATKEELTAHIQQAEYEGYSMSFDEFNRKVNEWQQKRL
ncbi:MAG: hypothetical protein LBR64_10625 [Dysgonamonadaceae bacterium]|nr:hypothetical protein [Dysgonamonadaceae bacterium]